ncbi:MAG: DNA-3-methyladenine glycosylase family protein [Burkholderiaceae bacterium]
MGHPNIQHLDWPNALTDLSVDPVMRRIIAAVGDQRPEGRGDSFTTLARSIVGQQISTKAADAIWSRLLALIDSPVQAPVQPHQILVRPHQLSDAGLSSRKAEYLLGIARWFHESPDHDQDLASAADAELIAQLTQPPGGGRWTAEMFLIFNLMRSDVFPADDLGVVKALEALYPEAFDAQNRAQPRLVRVGTAAMRARIRAFSERWAPHRSAATWLLWRSQDPTIARQLAMPMP